MHNDKGIVRRVDELGRVVIPKEIRHSLKIENGNMLEFFCDNEGRLELKKFEPVRELCDFGAKILFSLRGYVDCGFLLCDTQKVVVVQNFSKKESLGKKLESNLLQKLKTNDQFFECEHPLDASFDQNSFVFPLKVMGDVLGCLIVLSKQKLSQQVIASTNTVLTILCDYLDE